MSEVMDRKSSSVSNCFVTVGGFCIVKPNVLAFELFDFDLLICNVLEFPSSMFLDVLKTFFLILFFVISL